MPNQKSLKETVAKTSDDEQRRRKEKERKKEEESKKIKDKSKKSMSNDAVPKLPFDKKKNQTHEYNVPIVEVGKAEIETKNIELDKKIPIIEKRDKEINIPLIDLKRFTPEGRKVEFNKKIPEVEVKEGKLKIPVIKLQKTKISNKISKFNKNLPHVPVKLIKKLVVPIYRKLNRTKERAHLVFDRKIDMILLNKIMRANHLKEEDERFEEKPFKIPSAEGEPDLSGGDEETPEKIPNIIDNSFGTSTKELLSEGPKVILYKELEEDSTLGSFETLCIRAYREKEGGVPKLRHLKKADDFNIREIERYLEPEEKIVTIELDDKEFKKWFEEKNLRELLKRDIIGKIGFIIFMTRNIEYFKHFKKVLKNAELESRHNINLLFIEPKQLSFEQKKLLSTLAWGNLNLEEIEEKAFQVEKIGRIFGEGTFDDLFNKLSKKKFEDYLENLRYEKNSVFENATNEHEGESPESSEHKNIKMFIVKYLTEKLIADGILQPNDLNNPKAYEINDFIKTEEDTASELNNKRADVMISNGEVFEVETFFSEDLRGKSPTGKLKKTLKKYVENGYDKNINFVLDNLTLLRHLRLIKNFKSNQPERIRKKIKFFTLDIQTNKLISFNEIIKKLQLLEID